MEPTFDPIDEEFFGNYASFGIPKFDGIMKGGIPRGFMVIGITDPGAGAELFAKQFCSPAEEPENTIYVSTNETIESVLEVYRRFGWDDSIKVDAIGHEYNQRVLERELQASRYRLEGFKMPDVQKLAQTRFVEDESEDFLTELTNKIMGLGQYFRCAVDNLDFFFQRNETSKVISMLRMIQAHTQASRGILLLTVSSDVVSKSTEMEMSMIADMLLNFGVHMIGTDFETRMVVRKFRNAPENLSVISYRVTPEEGITPETVQRIA